MGRAVPAILHRITPALREARGRSQNCWAGTDFGLPADNQNVPADMPDPSGALW